MMRFIHGKDWDAKLLESLVTERIKLPIVKKCAQIQIGGMASAGNASKEHLVVLKTWMKTKEAK